LKRDKKSIHYKNLKDGDKIEIDGKEYVKVRLQLVDSLDMDSAKSMDNLETENNFLAEQNIDLSDNLEELKIKISLLEQLNHNLVHCNNKEATNIKNTNVTITKLESKIKKLSNLNKSYKNEFKQLVYQNNQLKENLYKQEYEANHLIDNDQFQKKIQELTETVELLNKKVSLLEQLNKNLANNKNIEDIRTANRDTTIIKYKKEITRLNELTKTYKDQCKLLEKQNKAHKIKLAKEKHKVIELLKQLQAHVEYEQVENTEESLY
jgi:hypothetical protein